MAGKTTQLVYKRRASHRKSKMMQISDFTPRCLDFGAESSMTNNDDNRPLKDFAAPRDNNIHLGYTVPNVDANNFEIKPTLLNMFSQKKFNGLANEDSN
jgi:hypothetical protein